MDRAPATRRRQLGAAAAHDRIEDLRRDPADALGRRCGRPPRLRRRRQTRRWSRPRQQAATNRRTAVLACPVVHHDGADGPAVRPHLARRQPAPCGRTVVPTPATPATASASTPGRSACDHGAHAAKVAILAAASLEVIPRCTWFRARAARQRLHLRSTWAMSSINDADESNRGSAVNSPAWSVNSTRERRRPGPAEQRGDPIVVAEKQLVVGQGIVLVDDGQYTHRQHRLQRSPGRAGTCPRAPSRPGRPTGRRPCRGRERDRGVALHQAHLTHRATACRARGSRGRAAPLRPRAGSPAATAPELTSTTSWPAPRTVATSAATASITSLRSSPASSVCRRGAGLGDHPHGRTLTTAPSR